MASVRVGREVIVTCGGMVVVVSVEGIVIMVSSEYGEC